MSAAVDYSELFDDAAIDREAVRRRGFAEFVRLAWPVVDTSPLQWNWHHDAICEHLEAVYPRREVTDLVINQPPSTSKSILASVLWPAWVWTLDPTHRWITASYALDGVALRDARKNRTLIESEWFQARWPHVTFKKDKTASASVSFFHNTAGGMRYTMTVRGAVTGIHGDTHIIDDPIDPAGAALVSGKELDEVNRWDRETMPTRFRDPKKRARVLTMQRVHSKDLSREWIRNGATVLCLPMRFDSKHPHRYPKDPRTVDGELLHSSRMPEESVVALERTLGPTATTLQLQQREAEAGGGIFKDSWFKRWTELPPNGTWSLSVDCAFKDTADSSFVVVQAWYSQGPNHYLVDQHRERMDFVRTVEAIEAMSLRYPSAFRKLIEDKANGPAVANVLKGRISGIEMVEPQGGKEARANAVQPLVAAGNVFVPDPAHAKYADGRRGAKWVTESEAGDPTPGGFLGEVTLFPRAPTDDQVDAMTQALNKNALSYGQRWAAAWSKVKA